LSLGVQYFLAAVLQSATRMAYGAIQGGIVHNPW
jgi:hypothetical protein